MSQRVGDRGITGLGLMMQLFGVFGLVISIFVLWIQYKGMMMAAQMARIDMPVWLFLVGFLSVARSIVQIICGRTLIEDRKLEAVRFYCYVGIGHSLIVGLLYYLVGKPYLFPDFAAPTFMTFLGISLALAAWPLALLAATFALGTPMEQTMPDSDDLGASSAGILMLVQGLALGLFGLLLLQQTWDFPSALLKFLILLLTARAWFHAVAGGWILYDPDVAEQQISRYSNLALLASGIVILTLLVEDPLGAFSGFFFVLIFASILVGWPLILKNFGETRHFDQEVLTTTDDGFWTACWLLIGMGALSLTDGLIAALEINLPAAVTTTTFVSLSSETSWLRILLGLAAVVGGVCGVIGNAAGKWLAIGWAATSAVYTVYAYFDQKEMIDSTAGDIMSPGLLAIGMSLAVPVVVGISALRYEEPLPMKKDLSLPPIENPKGPTKNPAIPASRAPVDPIDVDF